MVGTEDKIYLVISVKIHTNVAFAQREREREISDEIPGKLMGTKKQFLNIIQSGRKHNEHVGVSKN